METLSRWELLCNQGLLRHLPNHLFNSNYIASLSEMQNAWEKNDTWYGEEKMQVPYHDGYTAHTYHMPDTMSPTTGRKSMGDGSNSIHGSASQLGYTPLSFGSQTVIMANEATADTKPSFARLCLRIWQVISSIGTFAFQASAPAVSLFRLRNWSSNDH